MPIAFLSLLLFSGCTGNISKNNARVEQWKLVRAGGYLEDCAIDASDSLICWGYSYEAKTVSSLPDIQDFKFGLGYLCSLTENQLDCWDFEPEEQIFEKQEENLGVWELPPFEDIISFDIKIQSGFAITSEQNIVGWGAFSELLGEEKGDFVSVATGFRFACALEEIGFVTCDYVEDEFTTYENNIPPIKFKSISAGMNQICGISEEDELHCWGVREEYLLKPPEGKWKQVSVGGEFFGEGFERYQSDRACAISLEGDLACWGLEDNEEFQPPQLDTPWEQVSIGEFGACGLNDHELHCWGLSWKNMPQ